MYMMHIKTFFEICDFDIYEDFFDNRYFNIGRD